MAQWWMEWDELRTLLTIAPLALLSLAPLVAAAGALVSGAERRSRIRAALLLAIVGVVFEITAFYLWEETMNSLGAEASGALEEYRRAARDAFSALAVSLVLFGLMASICHRFDIRVLDFTLVLIIGTAMSYVIGLCWLVRAAYVRELLIRDLALLRLDA